MKKIIIPLVIILAVAFGVFYFSKSAAAPNVQTDVLGSFSTWKIYDVKSKVGLTLKYPADWKVDDAFPNYLSLVAPGGGGFSTYRVKAANKKQTLDQWLKAQDKQKRTAMGGQYNDYVISSKKMKIAKLAAIRRLEHADAAGFDILQTYLKNADYFYSFGLSIGPSGFYTPDDQKVYDKILSTVQFTK
ncbi:hypothetical protein HZA40_00085 [Candidatus Peregrinibacteria bacterium]|nr:hypothetical protein [Candidatus Peregrinibacteria bacterium]